MLNGMGIIDGNGELVLSETREHRRELIGGEEVLRRFFHAGACFSEANGICLRPNVLPSASGNTNSCASTSSSSYGKDTESTFLARLFVTPHA